jgi:photosynthetic reaction center cytochrome c subunit
MRAGRPDKIGDVAVNTLMGTRQGLPPVRFFFEANTGLLLRMVRYTENPMGRMPVQIDYSDYRDVDGVKTPFRWTLSRPNGRFTIQLGEVKANVPVEDAKFAKP